MAKPMVLGFAISGPIIHTNFSGEKIPKKYFELFLILIWMLIIVRSYPFLRYVMVTLDGRMPRYVVVTLDGKMPSYGMYGYFGWEDAEVRYGYFEWEDAQVPVPTLCYLFRW